MSHPQIITAADLSDHAFFDRPINPIAWPTVAIIGGNKTELKRLITAGEVAAALNNKVLLYSPSDVVNQLPDVLRAEVSGFGIHSQAQIHEVLEPCFSNSSSVLVGVGLQLSSAVQIALESHIESYIRPLILSTSTSALMIQNKNIAQKANIILVTDTIHLIKLVNALHIPIKTNASRGVFQLIDLAEALVTRLPRIRLVCASDDQVLYYDAPGSKSFIAKKINAVESLSILEVLFASLLSDITNLNSLHFRVKEILGFWLQLCIHATDMNASTIKRLYRESI